MMNAEPIRTLQPAALTFIVRAPLFPLLALWLLLVACGPATPTPFPTATAEVAVSPSPTATATPIPLTTYRNEAGAFAVNLPADWEVRPQGTTPLGAYYQLGPAPVGPGPASSALFVAPAAELTAPAAAETLLCGGGCAEAIALEETTIGGQPAWKTVLAAGEAALEWFFVEHQGRLIFFTLHDPQTLVTRADLLDSLSFFTAEPAAAATQAPAASTTAAEAAAPAGPTPTASWQVWQSAELGAAGVTLEVPGSWTRQVDGAAGEWTPVNGSSVRLGLAWRPLAPDEPLQSLLAPAAEIVASEPLTRSWAPAGSDIFSRGISVTLKAGQSWQRHALLQVGLGSYDLYVAGPAPGSLSALQPVLQQALATLAVTEVRRPFADPTTAAVAWFQALTQDPGGTAARAYMSARLRDELPPERSPLSLLELDERLVLYNLVPLSTGQQEAIVDASLTLLDERVVRRQLRLTRDPQAGWQVDGVVLAPVP